MLRTLFLFAIPLVAAGCAGSRTAATPPPDHPASPAAATAPLPPASGVLATHEPLQPARGGAEHQRIGPGSEDEAGGPGENTVGQGAPGHSGHGGHGQVASPPGVTGQGAAPPEAAGAQAMYVCPMHPEVTSGEPSRCPKCGMKLVQPTK